MPTLPQGQLGYAIAEERPYSLVVNGGDPNEMLKRFRDSFPSFNPRANPVEIVDIENQGQQGSCQGHSASSVLEVCGFLATGRKFKLSRACCYYLSQRRDGITGDNGSTLSGGNYVLTQHGVCPESDWPYPPNYDPRQPQGIQYPYKLKVSRPFTDVDSMRKWSDAGLPIQTGIFWNDSCNQEVIDDWRPGGGGHSTMLWTQFSDDMINNVNSWGKQWNGDGVHKWTWRSIERMLRDRFTVFIGYAPDEMSFPDLAPVV